MLKFKVPLQVGLIVSCVLILIGGAFHRQQSQAQTSVLLPVEQIEWEIIADDYYRYRFHVPRAWYKEMGVTPDRWIFYGDLVAVNPALGGALIKMDFAADPVGHWMPEPEVRNPLVDERGIATSTDLIPFLPPGDWTRIGGLPALIIQEKIDEGPFSEGTTVYILDRQMVYYLWIGYAPPAGVSKTIRAQSFNAYKQIVAHVLQNFAVATEEGQ